MAKQEQECVVPYGHCSQTTFSNI